MDWHALLGLPLPMAQEKLRQAGVEAEIAYSRSPRRQAQGDAAGGGNLPQGGHDGKRQPPPQLPLGGHGQMGALKGEHVVAFPFHGLSIAD